jgi:hypothetical protein
VSRASGANGIGPVDYLTEGLFPPTFSTSSGITGVTHNAKGHVRMFGHAQASHIGLANTLE